MSLMDLAYMVIGRGKMGVGYGKTRSVYRLPGVPQPTDTTGWSGEGPWTLPGGVTIDIDRYGFAVLRITE